MPVRKRRQKGLKVSNFALLWVVFKWLRDSEGVKLHIIIIIRPSSLLSPWLTDGVSYPSSCTCSVVFRRSRDRLIDVWLQWFSLAFVPVWPSGCPLAGNWFDRCVTSCNGHLNVAFTRRQLSLGCRALIHAIPLSLQPTGVWWLAAFMSECDPCFFCPWAGWDLMNGDLRVVFLHYDSADLHTGTWWLVTFMSYLSIMKLPICTQALDGWWLSCRISQLWNCRSAHRHLMAGTFVSYFSIMILPICTQALDGWWLSCRISSYYDSADLHTGTWWLVTFMSYFSKSPAIKCLCANRQNHNREIRHESTSHQVPVCRSAIS